jgi:phospholipid/cholesterol/gamma-HCH transport system permease protein
MSSEPGLVWTVSGKGIHFAATGSWTTAHADAAQYLVDDAARQAVPGSRVNIDLGRVDELDTLGAWLLERLSRGMGSGGPDGFTVVPDRYRGLLGELHQVNQQPLARSPPRNRLLRMLESVGRAAQEVRTDAIVFLEMVATLAIAIVRLFLRPRSFRLTSVVYHIYRVGWQALPIMLLITFLIGGIIAQQAIFHFRKFGAESNVVDMVGILVFRELGVLMVSIMAAGRSGSAYTAELGSMKMREEIDALRTMGLDPVEILIFPRVMALVLALPILAFFGAMAAIFGGGLVAWLYGGMSPASFVARLREAVSLTHFEVGMIKAPFMALLIGIVSCGEGFRVKGSAESLGRQTTMSVVKAIFLVIVLDGLFAIFFASIGM